MGDCGNVVGIGGGGIEDKRIKASMALDWGDDRVSLCPHIAAVIKV